MKRCIVKRIIKVEIFSSMEVHISSIGRVRQPKDQNLGFYQKGQQRISGLTAIIIDNGDGARDDSNNTINRVSIHVGDSCNSDVIGWMSNSSVFNVVSLFEGRWWLERRCKWRHQRQKLSSGSATATIYDFSDSNNSVGKRAALPSPAETASIVSSSVV